MSIALQPFADTHAPDPGNRKAGADTVARYREHLPASLIELWRTHGFGLYGGGLIQLIDPDQYRDVLWGWLMREEEDMSRLPIALSAFGDIFYYRRLSDAGDEDVCFIDPHTSATGDLAWSLDDFFNDWCRDPESVEKFLTQPMFDQAVAAHGPLSPGEIYYFVPALRLGGERSVQQASRGDAAVHLNFLLDLALDG